MSCVQLSTKIQDKLNMPHEHHVGMAEFWDEEELVIASELSWNGPWVTLGRTFWVTWFHAHSLPFCNTAIHPNNHFIGPGTHEAHKLLICSNHHRLLKIDKLLILTDDLNFYHHPSCEFEIPIMLPSWGHWKAFYWNKKYMMKKKQRLASKGY